MKTLMIPKEMKVTVAMIDLPDILEIPQTLTWPGKTGPEVVLYSGRLEA